MNKYILIFVEGETEVEFYQNYIIPHIKSLIPCDTSCWKVINVKGIGGFKVDAIQKFKKIYSDNSDYDFYVILCYDTDVFEYASGQPIEWDSVEKRIKNIDNKKQIIVKRIEANKCIEDWILHDLEGICKWLKIRTPKKITCKNGYEKLKKLFNDNDKVYVKGKKVEGLLTHIDVKKIIKKLEKELDVFYKIFDIK